MRLTRGDEPFGFSVSGTDPVVIRQILKDSPADVAGLQRGDQIVAVNGHKVTKYPAASVAILLK